MTIRKLDNIGKKMVTNFLKPFSYRSSYNIILFITLIILMLNELQPSIVISVRMKVVDLVAPIINDIKKPINYFLSIDERLKNYLHLEQENIILKQQNELLKSQLNQTKSHENENKHLKGMLNFVAGSNYKYITTQVALNIIGPYIHSAIILVGSNAGVKKGQSVINDTGLVGKVIEVGNTTSKILLITDLNSKIPAVTQNSKERTIISGDNSSLLSALYIHDDKKLKLGELIVTTGDGEFFPPNIAIGSIKSIKDGMVLVQPVVDINNLNYVSVIDF